MLLYTHALLIMLGVTLLAPALGRTAEVAVRFSLDQPGAGLFPSNLFTVTDSRHLTGRRVHLPLPNCTDRPTDCEDLTLLNTLDSFNLQPRLSIPFSGPIDVTTVSSQTIFLLRLGSARDGAHHPHHPAPHDETAGVIGINQAVWDPDTSTLHVESDAFLAPHTRYAFIVTRGVRDTARTPITMAHDFRHFLFGPGFVHQSPDVKAYRRELLHAFIEAVVHHGVRPHDVVGLSVFTTQSATALLEKIRDQLKVATPMPATFLLGPGGSRTTFALPEILNITFAQQVGLDPSQPTSFVNATVAINLLNLVPNAVGTLAFGAYHSPNYLTPDGLIPLAGTKDGTPVVQGSNEIVFTLFLPTAPPPVSGWPVAIVGHGLGSGKNATAPYRIAATLADHGIATIIIDAVGHGFGPASTLTVNRSSGAPVTFLAGGRGLTDTDGNGRIGSNESFIDLRLFDRDNLQQTVADLMQLVRVIEVGMDVDGNGTPDLDPSRIFYIGISLGANYGAMLLAVEPAVRVGVLHSPGGPLVEAIRLSGTGSRSLLGSILATRTPSLLNVGNGQAGDFRFNENIPLRNQSLVINDVPGAMAIQEVLETLEWLYQSANPVAYAAALRQQPLLIQFARGDQNLANPTTTAILRAGALADRATFYRHDLAFQDPVRNPTGTAVPRNPHVFMLLTTTPSLLDIALGAQRQVAEFLASDGTVMLDPDGASGPLFEVPIVPPLPEDQGFIP